MTAAADWSLAGSSRGLSAEQLAAFVDRSLGRAEGLLFRSTPREDLSEIGQWQRLQDVAFAGQLRAIVRTVRGASPAEREFVADEVALSISAGWMTGENLVTLAVRAGELPGLLESVEDGRLTGRHLRAVVDALHEVELTVEQRQAIVVVLLARFTGQTPGELLRILRRLILSVDAAAARRRKDEASRGRQVNTSASADGQGYLSASGPVEQIAQVRAALDAAMAAATWPAGDERTKSEREFDVLVELICGKAERGHWHVQVVVPYSTAAGGELEIAHLPGFGAVLASTARDLTDLAEAMTQVAVDHRTGQVLGITDPIRVTSADPTAANVSDPHLMPSQPPRAALERLLPLPLHTDPSTPAYTASPRLRRLVEARDRTCVFPGCHLPADRTDKDHRIPYPRGSTTADNLQCLCRRHHRAKQTSFTVRICEDGVTQWITRGGLLFERQPQGY